MKKAQYLALLGATALFLALFLGFDTKNDAQKTTERSRSIQAESTSMETLVEDAKAHIEPGQSAEIADLEQRIAAATDDKQRIELLKQLSGLWYRLGQLPVAAGLAQQVAEGENTDAAWSVAGASFYAALGAAQDPTLRKFCAERAVKAFESAASLSPENPEHRVNLALVYAENPPPDNPMQAVMLLRDLESKHPDNPSVYNALGRLAIKTGQWDRAIQRLEKAWALDNKNPNTPCLLAQAYQGAGNNAKSNEFAVICKQGR
jgi:Flp pilus assembly protein TadD